jgi:hypothetical protein
MAQKNYKKNQGPTVLETIVVVIFKALWFLVKLPFAFRRRRARQGISSGDKTEIRTKRMEIENWARSSNGIELQHAIVEADKLVDHVFILNGYSGETFADRLRSAEDRIDRNVYEGIWQGHKVRNQIAHEHNSNISERELKYSVEKLLAYLRNI